MSHSLQQADVVFNHL